MSEENEVVNQELEDAKLEATAMGITFHPSIGLEKLEEKINLEKAKQQELSEKDKPVEVKSKISQAEINKQAKDRALALVRIRINCMDPSKTQLDGEYFSAGNSVVNNITKYVPFNIEWHVPYIIYKTITQQHYQAIVKVGEVHGNPIKKGKQQRAYAVEVLPPLSAKEIKAIAQRQQTANSVG